MSVNHEVLTKIDSECNSYHAKWVAVTKMRSIQDLEELYKHGIRDFGENKAQELLDKYPKLPTDVKWHFIGHLQSNKVRSIIDKVEYIHSIDSEKLLLEVQKEAAKILKRIKVLIQIHVAAEETKYGFSRGEVLEFFDRFNPLNFPNVEIVGLMAMASFTEDKKQVKMEFQSVKDILDTINSDGIVHLKELSMGMSGDYHEALESGSTILRIGSILYGSPYTN